ncbi:SWI/SNF complex subunit SWI3C homolog isoform X1 [Zingiber officinale]|uniref:SWI/SNF complex subunit SWI3C homolog isoform X1 n=1 Tax=Zingiber officinale TaxID=94328 RepID=UPI001C4C9E90|nr:SWI/SNF complex subunit SWI3C homolog isoform X1 [Zingiber officinale]
MSPASPSDRLRSLADSRLKWRKRKRDANRRRQKPHEDEEDEDEDDEDAAVPVGGDAEEVGRNSSPIPAAADPVLDLRESEVLSDGGQRISDLPTAFRRTVNRPHTSVLALVAAERSNSAARSWSPPFLENISHGQLQVLSAVLPDNPSLQQPPDLDKPSTYVCTPLPLMEGKGMIKRLDKDQLLIVPMHSDWFSPSTVHRLERQVVPHFFLGKSNDHTLEKYIGLRNKIISKYLENPGKRLSFADCQALVPNNDLYDLSRIVRFLDHWGIINYLAASSVHRGLRMAGSLLREDANGELQLQTAPLRSIDSLILFDRPKCSIRLEDVALLSHSGQDSDALVGDLDARIRERIAEHTCNFCSCPLTKLHYQSQKEVDIMLCSNCFHDAKFVTGHSSLDFVRMDSVKENSDLEGDSWTDHETLLLLEAMEKYNDNWNEIAEYIGSKSKAQCILHFLRLPMENGLLESIELQHFPPPSESLDRQDDFILSSNSNGKIAGNHDLGSANSLPFINSSNPVMSLLAFLTSSVGPRVAAACASAALSILTRDDSRNGSENSHADVDTHAPHASFSHQKDGTAEGQLPHSKNGSTLLSSELVEHAAMAGLSAAAMKAKLFADQEEREIQRLAATIINHQLKRLELKLKQFAELETLLLKECEQAERMRQRLSAERSRMMTSRFGASPNSVPSPGGAAPAGAAAAAVAMGANPIPGQTPMVAPATGQASFGNNLNPGHRQMPLMQRQQMFGLGPRLPLSAIHPAPASQNAGFNSAIPNSSTPNHHPLSRSSSSGNTRI